MEKKIGFIGLGLMGGNMAKRLLSCGFEITGFDAYQPTIEKLQSEVENKINVASSIAEVVQTQKVILTSLPGPPEVEAVYWGESGILANARPGTVTIDLSTVDPQTTQKISIRAKDLGSDHIDSPVSGGPPECFAGTLVLFLGGEKEAIAKVPTVLESLAKKTYHTGPSGCGNIVKLINNAISQSDMVLSAETFVLGLKAGIDADTLFNIVGKAGGRSNNFCRHWPESVMNGTFLPTFRLKTSRKDVRLALEMSAQLDVPMPVISTIYEIQNASVAKGWGDLDSSSIIRFYEEIAGVYARSATAKK